MARRLALLALAALLLAGCGSTNGSPEPEASAAVPGAPGGGDAITGTDLDGEPVSFAEFRGRPLLVNVWSSW